MELAMNRCQDSRVHERAARKSKFKACKMLDVQESGSETTQKTLLL